MRNNKTLTALSAAAILLGVLGTGSIAFASDNTGEYSGGFVVPGTSAVNPVYHPGWFAGSKARGAYGYVAPRSKSSKARDAYDYVAPHSKTVQPAIPPQEDDYGSEAGKD